MNNKIYITLILGLSMIACTGDLDQYPETQILASNYYTTEENVEATVTATYNELQALYDYYMILYGEIPSDNTYIQAPNSNGGARPLEDFGWTSTSGFVGSIWENAYEGIFYSNTVLEIIEQIPFDSEVTKETRIGEMIFIRGFLYDHLSTIYGAVPLILEGDRDPSYAFEDVRTPVENLRNQVEDDLLRAIELLPEANSTGRVNQYAARAILAKFYMKQKDFQGAQEQLAIIIDSGRYSLVPLMELYGVANENNREDIFSIQYASDLDGRSEGSSFYYFFTRPDNEGGQGAMAMEPSLYNRFDEADLRRGLINESNNVYYINKWTQSPSNDTSDGGDNHYVVRYADVLLLYAECLNENGNTQNALTYLNKVRDRAGLVDFNTNNQAEVREAIALERRFELVGEGHRWFDLLRTGQSVEVMNAFFQQQDRDINVSEYRLLAPIPQSEINITDMEQNPGY